jgi:phage terminase small subunit
MEIVKKQQSKSKPRLPRPPKYLKPTTRRWWKQVVETWTLDEHHIKLLTLAAASWDRCEQARQALDQFGLTWTDEKLNRLSPRPEVAVERDSRIAFARLLRELDLDTETPTGPRPPALKSNRR